MKVYEMLRSLYRPERVTNLYLEWTVGDYPEDWDIYEILDNMVGSDTYEMYVEINGFVMRFVKDGGIKQAEGMATRSDLFWKDNKRV